MWTHDEAQVERMDRTLLFVDFVRQLSDQRRHQTDIIVFHVVDISCGDVIPAESATNDFAAHQLVLNLMLFLNIIDYN